MSEIPQTDPPLTQEEEKEFCSQILSNLVKNILTTFEKQQQPKETKESIPLSLTPLSSQQRQPVFLSHFAEKYSLSILQTLNFSEKSVPKSYQLKHLEVHKQHVYNLCGYHTLYNLIEVCKLIKSQDLSTCPRNLFNPASFWKFHFECTKYLQNYAITHEKDRTKYPWTDYHIKWGDLERAYVQPLTKIKEFQQLITSDNNFKISYFTFEFQFNRMIYSAEHIGKLQKEIDEFVNEKNSPVHNVKMIMMGITNHWYFFLVHKYLDHIEFWMLDSKNRDHLLWSKEQIDQFLTEENERRQKEGRSPLTSFRMWVAQNAILDTQISTDLLVNCFLGNKTLYHFLVDSDIRMLSQAFIETFIMNPDYTIEKALIEVKEVIVKKTKDNEKDEEFKELIQKTWRYIQAYNGALRVFFTGERSKYLYPSSKGLLQNIITVLYTVMVANAEGEKTCSLVQGFVKLCQTAQLQCGL